jgi:hypothetical protein
MNEQLPKDELVHRVCQFLRDEVGPHIGIEMTCAKCPVSTETPYGPGTHMCVARAQELIEIVRSGS